jgi:hypothetical protein
MFSCSSQSTMPNHDCTFLGSADSSQRHTYVNVWKLLPSVHYLKTQHLNHWMVNAYDGWVCGSPHDCWGQLDLMVFCCGCLAVCRTCCTSLVVGALFSSLYCLSLQRKNHLSHAKYSCFHYTKHTYIFIFVH